MGVIATAVNVANKNRQANSVVGYLSNGDRVYADGHAVAANGTVYYPGDQGQTLRCQNNRCAIAGTNGMYQGRRVGYQNHRGPNGRVLYERRARRPGLPRTATARITARATNARA